MPESHHYLATLIRGKHYSLIPRNLTFTQGVPIPVDEDVYQYLSKSATDPVTVSSGEETEVEHRSKFKFVRKEGPVPDAPALPLSNTLGEKRVVALAEDAEPEDEEGLLKQTAGEELSDFSGNRVQSPKPPKPPTKVAAKKAARNARER